jgi:hypothetical protein
MRRVLGAQGWRELISKSVTMFNDIMAALVAALEEAARGGNEGAALLLVRCQ